MTAHVEDSSIGHRALDPRGHLDHDTEADHHGSRLGKASPRAKKILAALAILVFVLAAIVVAYVTWHHRHVANEQRAQRETSLALGPHVNVIKVPVSDEARTLTLPGDVRGFQQITLYAKISGYVRDIRVERGQKVKADQVLAILFSPENDEQVRSARSDAQVKKINAERALRLAVPGVISEVDRDNALNSARMADAELARVGDLKEYELVRAPFSGVVTARYVDDGALLPAATGSTQAAQPVVDLADMDTVRVFIYVGQDAAPFIHMNDAVELWQDERPEHVIHASISHCTDSLDPRTRTMTCEADFDNRPHGVLPGTFVHVRVKLKVPPAPAIPDEALVVRDGKNMVAIVDMADSDDAYKNAIATKQAENKPEEKPKATVRFVEVQLGTNDGRTTRVDRGLAGGELIALSPPMELEDGSAIQPMDRAPKPPEQKNDSATFVPQTSADAGAATLDSNKGASKADTK